MTRRHSLPAEVYALVEQTPATVLLEGGKPDNTKTSEEPWTRLFTAPLRVRAAYRVEELPALFGEIESAVRAGLWAAGFFSYECGNAFEPKAGMRKNPAGPLAWIGIYERGYGFDHRTGCFVEGEPPGLAELREGADKTRDGARVGAGADVEIDAEFALSEAEYTRRIEAIHEWIKAGDVYQLNFTASWSVRTRGSVAALYARLRARQPAQYGAFLHWRQGRRILSFSPELFFHVEREGGARRITTRPMKGTAARGRNPREDNERAEWLHADAKNRSENVMIVDLLRNDLGRLCANGDGGVARRRWVRGDIQGAVSVRVDYRSAQGAGHATAGAARRSAARRLYGSHRVFLAAADDFQRGDSDA